MIPKIYENLISLLESRTDNGAIKWDIANYSNNLTTNYDGTVFEIWNGFDDNIEKSFIGFSLKQNGQVLDSFYCNMYEYGYSDLERLQGAAQRSAHNINPRVNDLISKLKGI